MNARNRTSLSLIAAVTLVFVAFALAPPASADDASDHSATPGAQGRGHSGQNESKDKGNETQAERENESRHDAERKPGRLHEENGSFEGRYIMFQMDASTCTIRDYRLYNVSFFDSIQLPGACEPSSQGASDRGSKTEFESADAKIRLHDAPNGLIRFEAENGTIVFDPAAGVDVTQSNKSLDLVRGNLSARLFMTGNGSLAWDGSSARASDGSGNFLAHPLKGDSEARRQIHEAIRQGKVGGEIDVMHNSTDILVYDDVVVKASKKDDGYRFLVDANLTEGRVFVVNFAPGVFQSGQIAVRYYDVDNQTYQSQPVNITAADNESDALSIEPGEGPEYFIVHDQGGNGTYVLVAVPHFSAHVFEVLSVPPEIVPIIVYGVVFGLLFVGLAAIGMFLGRRRSTA